jgi:hypothetical protein
VLKHFSLGPVLSPRVDAATTTDPLKRSRWEYGMTAAAKAFEQPRSGYGAAQVFLGAGTGVVIGAAFSGLPLLAQFVIGGASGLAVYWGVPTAWAGVGWVHAPVVQRNEARTELTERKRIEELIELEDQLRINRANNKRTLEEIKARGLSGPLADDADPWVRQVNDQLGFLAEGAKLPDLVPRLTLKAPRLSTWEEARQAADKIDKKVGEVLQDDLFVDVRRLVSIVDDLRREKAHPAVVFHEPRTDDHIPLGGGGEAAYAFGRVENRKSHPPLGVTGQGARLTLEYFEFETERPLFAEPFEARWRSATSPLELSPFQHHDYSIPLRANGTVYEFDLGRKSLTEGGWFAIDAQLALIPTGTKRARVVATVEGDNFAAVQAQFVVQSNGYNKGLSASLFGPETKIDY